MNDYLRINKMKKSMLAVILFWLSLSGCNTVLFNAKSVDYVSSLEYDLFRYVKSYYCIYLEYPSIEELYTYCWGITNSANDFRFQSFADYAKAPKSETNGTGAEDFLCFLSENKTNLTFIEKRGKLQVLWKGRKAFQLDYDYCKMKDNYRDKWKFYCFFDSIDAFTPMSFDDEDTFIRLRKEIYQKYYSDRLLQPSSKTILLRYNRDTGYKVFCPTEVDVYANNYLKELGCALDTFLLNRNVQMIQFITVVPYL